MSTEEILARVRAHYPGARLHFVLARLQLRVGHSFEDPSQLPNTPEFNATLRRAVRELCPEVDLEPAR